ncbi:hypothetical protein GE061_010186 [Apolygus lucorum]|uniref:MIB/HERC2 domain-containing protein n=1 Tax=Apolygus lucorum TaxID=248454 RepID=A0A8S9Y2M3_APOLU|nr:hypothetical protein GE061_010186 [Apolygus lucorum]
MDHADCKVFVTHLSSAIVAGAKGSKDFVTSVFNATTTTYVCTVTWMTNMTLATLFYDMIPHLPILLLYLQEKAVKKKFFVGFLSALKSSEVDTGSGATRMAVCGRSGRVLDIKCWENETWRSVVNVTWTTGSTNIYRVGHKGKVDLKCEEPASPGTYYPEHLPIVGKESDNDVPRPELAPLQQFSIGERVKVAVEDIEALKRMQEGHGGWNDRMCEVIGVLGRVHRVTDKGDIRVFYPRLNSRWTINPRALAKVPLHIEVGDVIRVSSDKNMVAKLQVGHGEWIQAMSSILGKVGMVMKSTAMGICGYW